MQIGLYSWNRSKIPHPLSHSLFIKCSLMFFHFILQDVCISCGLVATAAITFVIMFLPKGRQLSAMGRDGVYAEDRTDVYTGSSSTQSTGSGSFDDHQFGDPSPSFFPIKPSNKLINQFKSEKDVLREKLATSHSTPPTPGSPRKHNHGNFFCHKKFKTLRAI